MKNYKKLSIVAFSLILITATAVNVTYAYFSKAKTVTNTFRINDIKFSIKLYETGDGDIRTSGGTNYFDVTDNNIFNKKYAVINDGDLDEFVRVRIKLSNGSLLTQNIKNIEALFQGLNEDWKRFDEVKEENDYLYVSYYKLSPLSPGSISTIFDYILIPSSIDSNYPKLDRFEMTIEADAIQADNNVSDSYAAFASFE